MWDNFAICHLPFSFLTTSRSSFFLPLSKQYVHHCSNFSLRWLRIRIKSNKLSVRRIFNCRLKGWRTLTEALTSFLLSTHNLYFFGIKMTAGCVHSVEYAVTSIKEKGYFSEPGANRNFLFYFWIKILSNLITFRFLCLLTNWAIFFLFKQKHLILNK